MESVKFVATLEDYEDTSLRFRRVSKAARRMRQRDIRGATAASVAGVFVAVLVLSEGGLVQAVTSAVVTLIVMLIGYPWFHDWWVARKTRQYLRDSLGPVGRIPIEIALDETGVQAQSPSESVRLPWDQVQSIHDTPEGIEFISDTGIVMARSRGFENADARARFLNAARAFSSRN